MEKIYREGSEIPYLFIDELTKEEQEPFELWLFGSTTPLIKGQEHRSTAYVSDYRKWIFKTQLINGNSNKTN
jgi:hypothetical protein